MEHVLTNAGIFVAFYVIALLHHCIYTQSGGLAGHLKASIFATATNPALHDAAKDFVAHLIVYSGYVIPNH